MAVYTLERRFVPRLDIPNFQSRWGDWVKFGKVNPLVEEGAVDESGRFVERWVSAGEVSDDDRAPAWSIDAHLAELKHITGADHRVTP